MTDRNEIILGHYADVMLDGLINATRELVTEGDPMTTQEITRIVVEIIEQGVKRRPDGDVADVAVTLASLLATAIQRLSHEVKP